MFCIVCSWFICRDEIRNYDIILLWAVNDAIYKADLVCICALNGETSECHEGSKLRRQPA